MHVCDHSLDKQLSLQHSYLSFKNTIAGPSSFVICEKPSESVKILHSWGIIMTYHLTPKPFHDLDPHSCAPNDYPPMQCMICWVIWRRWLRRWWRIGERIWAIAGVNSTLQYLNLHAFIFFLMRGIMNWYIHPSWVRIKEEVLPQSILPMLDLSNVCLMCAGDGTQMFDSICIGSDGVKACETVVVKHIDMIEVVAQCGAMELWLSFD